MMKTTFEERQLPVGFTLRIVETVKRIKIHPSPGNPGMPWGLSIATGIIIAVLSMGSHLSLPDLMEAHKSSELPGEMAVTEAGEMPVDVLRMSRMPVSFDRQGDSYRGGFQFPDQQNAVLMAPRGEDGQFPEEPSARLGKGRLGNIAYSPDGKLLAASDGMGILRLYDANNLNEIGLLQNPSIYDSVIAFSPDGKILASDDRDGTIYFWDVSEREQIGKLSGPPKYLSSIAFSPDGKILATASETDKNIRLWDAQTQREIGVLRDPEAGWSVAFSPDGKTIASAGTSGLIRLWGFKEQRQIGALQGHAFRVESIVFSPDGKWLASISQDGTARIWDVQEQKQMVILKGHEIWTNSVAFSPDGKWVASGGGEGTILLWEVNIPIQGKPVESTGKLPGTWGEVKKTELLQNFPNPLNPETWIPYRLGKDSSVAIKICASSGQHVRTLELGHKPAGLYTGKTEAAHWDGNNESGEPVASGIYFYTIQTDDYTATKKMILAK